MKSKTRLTWNHRSSTRCEWFSITSVLAILFAWPGKFVCERPSTLWPQQAQEESNQSYVSNGIANPSDDRFKPLLFPLIHEGKLHESPFPCKEPQAMVCLVSGAASMDRRNTGAARQRNNRLI
jgi:hypothetical protein